MTDELPAEVLAKFDQSHAEVGALLDKLVDAHREMSTTEARRIMSIQAQIEAAEVNSDWSHQLLAVAVDRLARTS